MKKKYKYILLLSLVLNLLLLIVLINIYQPNIENSLQLYKIKRAPYKENLRKYAIVVAQTSKEGPLRCGENDLNSFIKILSYNNFKPEDIKPLLIEENGTTYFEAANDFKLMIRKAQKMNLDWLYIYFSGHGKQIRDDSIPIEELDDSLDECLVFGGNYIIDDTIKMLFDGFPVHTKIVFITDCCHSGSNFKITEDLMQDTCLIDTIKAAESLTFIFPTDSHEMIHFASIADENSSACLPNSANSTFSKKLFKMLHRRRAIFSKVCEEVNKIGAVCNTNFELNELSFYNRYFFE